MENGDHTWWCSVNKSSPHHYLSQCRPNLCVSPQTETYLLYMLPQIRKLYVFFFAMENMRAALFNQLRLNELQVGSENLCCVLLSNRILGYTFEDNFLCMCCLYVCVYIFISFPSQWLQMCEALNGLSFTVKDLSIEKCCVLLYVHPLWSLMKKEFILIERQYVPHCIKPLVCSQNSGHSFRGTRWRWCRRLPLQDYWAPPSPKAASYGLYTWAGWVAYLSRIYRLIWARCIHI